MFTQNLLFPQIIPEFGRKDWFYNIFQKRHNEYFILRYMFCMLVSNK